MERITIFGKGGIGKSTVSASLAAAYARRGLKVLLVGCDPKHDTTVALTGGRPIRTVVETSMFMDSGCGDASQFLVRGRLGVDCVEAGGPEPGIGCAGRGISRMIELMEGAGLLSESGHDVALFDVLGDVVCGGFAAPLRQGFADKVVIVTSEELMSLYAANNIARAIRNYSANGVALCGLVANLRDPGATPEVVERFAALIGTRVIASFGRDPRVREAEYKRLTVVEHAPQSPAARALEALAGALVSFDRSRASVPAPLSDERFHELSRVGFTEPEGPAPSGAGPSGSPHARPTDGRQEGDRRPGQSGAQEPAPQGRLGPDGGRGPSGEGTGTRGSARSPSPGGAGLLADLRWQASLWEGEPGRNSQVWGSADQWRRFFCDFETRRHARTRLEVREPVVHVWHQDLECSYVSPDYFDASLPGFFKFPWPRLEEEGGPPPDGKGGRDPEGFVRDAITNLRDLDVVHGGGRTLDDAIEAAVRQAEAGAEAVVVHSTCVPTVIGDDAGAVVERWRERTRVPIVYTNPAVTNEEVDVGLTLFERLRKKPSFLKAKRRPRSVNLVGFPETRGLAELLGILRQAGVEVNARVMPRLDLGVAERYMAAPVQVLYPTGAYEAAYRDVFEKLPLKTLRLEAPFGPAAARRWLRAVAAAAGRDRRLEAPLARAWRPHAAAWREAAREAAGHGLAFVVDPVHVRRLTEPAQMWGVPVLAVLREMGFAVEVLCFGAPRKEGPRLSFFSTPEDLARLLREGRFQAVYSEYAFDGRIAAAGKAQFALDAFELGFGGAARAAARLNGLCRWPFFRRYARYLGEAA